jgi:cytochrome c peroxidase
MKIYQLSFVFAAILLLSSCIHDKVDVDVKYYTAEEYSVLQAALDLPESVDEYNFALSRGAAPAISNTKATLGRVLFYDTQLSRNNTVSCALLPQTGARIFRQQSPQYRLRRRPHQTQLTGTGRRSQF